MGQLSCVVGNGVRPVIMQRHLLMFLFRLVVRGDMLWYIGVVKFGSTCSPRLLGSCLEFGLPFCSVLCGAVTTDSHNRALRLPGSNTIYTDFRCHFDGH